MKELNEVIKNKADYENFEIRMLAFILMFTCGTVLILFGAWHWALFAFKAFFNFMP